MPGGVNKGILRRFTKGHPENVAEGIPGEIPKGIPGRIQKESLKISQEKLVKELYLFWAAILLNQIKYTTAPIREKK